MSETVYLAYCTCPNQETAEQLATGLVDAGLAACVNVVSGMLSVYRWQGETHRDVEFLLLIKTTAERLPAMTTYIRQSHPYELPEVIAHPITVGLADYLEWVRSCTNSPA